MALSNTEVAQRVAAFLAKYFDYNAQSETLTFDLADFNNNIQSYLAALRTDFMLAISGDYDGAEDYALNSAEELTAAANSVIEPVNDVCNDLFGFNISELLGDDSSLQKILSIYIAQWRSAGLNDPINALFTRLNSILANASDQAALTNVINQSLVIPFVSARGIQTTAALAADINNNLTLLPALNDALSDSAKANIAQVVGTVLNNIQSQLGNINHLNFAITGTRLDYNSTIASIYFGNLSGEESLLGGDSDDVVLLGKGDSVNSGAGADFIIITDGTATINSGYIVDTATGVQYATVVGSTFEDNHNRQYIGLSTLSAATVVGFENGTLDSSDVIYLVDSALDDLTVQFSSDALIINNKNGGSLTLAKNDSAVLPSVSGAAVTTSSLALGDSVPLIINNQNVLITSSGQLQIINGGNTMQITYGDSIYSLDGELYNSTFDFTDSTITISSLGSSVSLTSAAAGDTFDVVIDEQKVRAINDSISAAFDSNIDYYALGDDSTLTAVTGTTKINDIELITNGTLTVTGKHYDLDDGSSYNLAQTITGLSGGDSITVNDLWSDATFAYYVSDDGTTISRISDNSIVYTGSADTLSSLNFGTISFMDYFTQTVGEVVDAFNTRYATFNGTTLTIDAKTLRTNLNTQIAAAQSELASVTTVTSALVIEKMDDIIKNIISSNVSIKNLLNEDMMSVMSSQIDTILSSGGDPLNIFSTLDDYNGDIFSWICDSLVVPVAQILGDSTLDRLAANLSDRLSSHNTDTIILTGSEDTVSIGAYYGDSVDASASSTENLIIASGNVTDSPQKDLVLLTGNDTHSGSIQNALVLGKNTAAATVSDNLVEQGIYINGIHYDLGGTNMNQFTTTLGGEDMTITAATLSGSSAFSSDDSGVISISAAEGASVGLTLDLDGLTAATPISANFTLSGGSLVYNPESSNFSLSKGTAISFSRDEQIITLTTTEDTSATCKVEEDIYYLTLDNEAKANIAISSGSEDIVSGDLETGGVLSYRPSTGTFGLTGANSSHGNGTNTFVQLTINNNTLRAATNDTTIVFIPTYTDGIFNFNFPNEAKNAMLITLSGNGETFFENNVSVDGTINLDIANQELSLTKDTEFKVNFGDEYVITLKATDDAGGNLTFTDDGVRFAPNTNDGDLELTFDGTDRKANLDIDGAIIFGADGKISLEDGTEVNLTWEDGSKLNLTSHGSTGSIAFGENGLEITSDDEKLDLELTMAYGYSTKISGLKGSLWYNAGKVVLDEGTKLTGTGTLGSNVVNVTLETIDGDGNLDFSTSNGFVYGAGTGKLKVTYELGDRKSTFTVNEGSVLFGNNISEIAEGTNLETDLQDFMPALNLTTTDAGTYTINGQTITTTAEGLALTATDNYMSFVTNDDVVKHEGMTFAGDGTVSLSSAGVILGAGVVATGFDEGESFILAEAGDVTADARIFELSNIEGTPREIPMIITVTGAQDGFIFSRTLTKESEAYLDDALEDESFENYTSPYIDQVFTEKFIASGDNSYRIRTDAIGLEEVIGISDGATITGGASLADEPTLSYYNLITDTEGSFTIGEKTYNITGDSSVAIRARFEVDTAPYASYFDSLNGTVSGDFTGGQFSINGAGVGVLNGDSDITIAADEEGYRIEGFDEGASLQVAEAGTYTINAAVVDVEQGDIITNINNQILVEDGGNIMDLNLTLGDYNVSLSADSDNLSATQTGLTFTPSEEGSALGVVLSRGDTTVAGSTLLISNGTIDFNSSDSTLTVTENTSISTALGTGSSLTARVVDDDATIQISTSAGNLTFTPETEDGTLDLTLANGIGSISANLEVVSGAFSLGTSGTLTVVKDTELKIDFGDDYIIDFKATDDAGGSLSIGIGGLTFAPNSDDGGLELSVTQNGQTRSASLNVTGSLTYSLNGTISLANGTVVRNVFEDGNILTITANTDASGSIIFTPQNGLIITPSTPDALSVVFTSGDIGVFNATSIDGVINYKGGIITISDRTSAPSQIITGFRMELYDRQHEFPRRRKKTLSIMIASVLHFYGLFQFNDRM